jgi:RsiW-degrading membrane proteinase PrsW (M82 family)
MLIVASGLAAFIPMFVYLIIIWLYDRYDREPFGLVLKNYFWGAFGAIILAVIWSIILSNAISLFIKNPAHLDKVESMLLAPFIEEITKGVFLFITVRSRKFDNITDGIVYGGAIGLGFGMTENFLYFISYGTSLSGWLTIVVIRTLFSAVMHCLATATFGAFLAYSKFKSTVYKITFPIAGLLLAMLLHSVWNVTVSFESTALLGLLFIVFSVAIFLSVFSISVSGEKKIIYNELLEEAERGLIPVEHLAILNSRRRNSIGWVDESIRKLYIRAATTLAFRKMQLKNSKGLSRIYYEDDVEYYRNFIHNLLTQKVFK